MLIFSGQILVTLHNSILEKVSHRNQHVVLGSFCLCASSTQHTKSGVFNGYAVVSVNFYKPCFGQKQLCSSP